VHLAGSGANNIICAAGAIIRQSSSVKVEVEREGKEPRR
jgi:hypothetical protein